MRLILKSKVVWIAALGYFVDLYDLVLYGVVRVQSLTAIGVPESELFAVGSRLLNLQMGGMLLGGLAWGVLGDKRGRRSALFGSIFLYSLATLLNAFVTSVDQYALLRFVAGFGLAGELGAAITLVSESLPSKSRGLGAALVATVGFFGAATASLIAQNLSWKMAYLSGGLLGFSLLLARVAMFESSLYSAAKAKATHVRFGSVITLFQSSARLKRLILFLLVGVPIWYVAGILSYFAPEFANEFHIVGQVTAGNTIMVGYLGAILGDVACGLLSQYLKSRKKALLIFVCFGAFFALSHVFWMEGATANEFYLTRALIGFGNGYVAVLVAWIAESFGTNLRATLTTLIPNLIRASVIPLTAALQWLKPTQGLVWSGFIIGAVAFGAAIFSTLMLSETFSKDLDYLEV